MEFLSRQGAWSRPLTVLDAGCGPRSSLQFPSGSYVVGIDISWEDLDQNDTIDEKICADLQTYEFPEHAFDIIVCKDVLEHLSKPIRVLEGFRRALKPDGILILALPNVLSLKGLVTKFTPYRFHAWVYRRYLPFSSQDAFPTVLNFTIAPSSLKRWAAKRGLEVVYIQKFEAFVQTRIRERLRLTGWRWRTVRNVLRLVSLGAVEPDATDYLIVLMPAAAFSPR
jgi:SAM-dependent methyltransferase